MAGIQISDDRSPGEEDTEGARDWVDGRSSIVYHIDNVMCALHPQEA